MMCIFIVANRPFVMSIYDSIADWFILNRQRHIGIQEVEKVAAMLPPGGKVLDLGCGHGIPITEYLVAHGFNVYAIDNLAELIAKFRENFPGVPAEWANIQESGFFDYFDRGDNYVYMFKKFR